jgi:hypothetical protein
MVFNLLLRMEKVAQTNRGQHQNVRKYCAKATDVVEEARRRERDKEGEFAILGNIVGQLKAKIKEQNARISEVKEQMGDKLLAYIDLTKARGPLGSTLGLLE